MKTKLRLLALVLWFVSLGSGISGADTFNYVITATGTKDIITHPDVSCQWIVKGSATETWYTSYIEEKTAKVVANTWPSGTTSSKWAQVSNMASGTFKYTINVSSQGQFGCDQTSYASARIFKNGAQVSYIKTVGHETKTVPGSFPVNPSDMVHIDVYARSDACGPWTLHASASVVIVYPYGIVTEPNTATRATTSGPHSGTVNAKEGRKHMGTWQIRPFAQQGGTMSSTIYSLIDTKHPTSGLLEIVPQNGMVYATTSYSETQTRPWSDTEVGSGSVSPGEPDKRIHTSSLVAPNRDTVWSVSDDNDDVETWMVGEQLYARVVPGLYVTPSESILGSEGFEGGPFTPNSWTYELRNTGVQSLTWEAVQVHGVEWINVSESLGTLDPGESTTITISINAEANKLTYGNEHEQIDIRNSTNGQGGSRIEIYLTVLYPPFLSVIPFDDFTCSGREGGPFVPNSKTYILTNIGGQELIWTATSSKAQSWISLEPPSGTLGGGENTKVTVSINSDADNLLPGEYCETVRFTNITNETDSGTDRSVDLTVIPVDDVLGDVSGNGRISVYDASLTAQYATGLFEFTPEQIQLADVSGNGKISVYDASLIAQYAVRLIDTFPVDVEEPESLMYASDSKTTSEEDVPPVYNSPDYPADAVIEIPIIVSDVTGSEIVSVALQLEYDSSRFSFSSVSQAGTIVEDWYCYVNETTPGTVEVGLYNVSPMVGQGILLNVYLEGDDQAADLTGALKVKGAEFNEGPATAVQVGFPDAPPKITSTPVTTAFVGLPYTYDVEATGSPPLSFSLTTSPSGMTINETTGLVEWAPTRTEVGSHTVIVCTRNSHGSDSQVFNIDVRPPTLILPILDQEVTVGELFRYHSDASGPLLISFRLVSSPSGMTIDRTTGLIEWTPDESQIGVHTIAVTAIGPAGSDSALFKITVQSVQTMILPIPDQEATEGQLFSYDVEASGTPPLTYYILGQASSGLSGMTIDSATGLIEWTPDESQIGVHTVYVCARGSAGSDTSFFNITVFPFVRLTVTPIPDQDATEGQLFTYDVEAFGAIHYCLSNAPTGMTIDSTTGLIEWMPDASQRGVHTIAVNAIGPAGSDTSVFNITVSGVSLTITPIPDQEATVGQLFSYDVEASGTPPLTYYILGQASSGLSGMTINSATGLIEWTPDESQIGVHTVYVCVRGPTGSDTAVFNITVSGVPPTITPIPDQEATVGQLFSYDVEASGTPPLTYYILGQASSGLSGMTINSATGLIEWTPDESQIGVHTVYVCARGPAASDTAVFNITVSGVSLKITPIPDQDATVGQLFSYDVEAFGAIHYSLYNVPTGMTIDSATGLIEWTPDESQIGAHTISVTAIGPAGSDTAVFNITVSGVSLTITPIPGQHATCRPPFQSSSLLRGV